MVQISFNYLVLDNVFTSLEKKINGCDKNVGFYRENFIKVQVSIIVLLFPENVKLKRNL